MAASDPSSHADEKLAVGIHVADLDVVAKVVLLYLVVMMLLCCLDKVVAAA